MKSNFVFGVALAVLLQAATACFGGIMVTTVATPSPGGLQVGDEVMIDVLVQSDVMGGELVNLLQVIVDFDPFVFDVVTTPIPVRNAALIPGPLAANFDTNSFFVDNTGVPEGFANGNYTDPTPFYVEPILVPDVATVFYSFKLKATAAGTGSVSVDPMNATAGNGPDELSVTPPTDIPFSVTPNIGVPEPATLAIWGAMSVAGLIARRARRSA